MISLQVILRWFEVHFSIRNPRTTKKELFIFILTDGHTSNTAVLSWEGEKLKVFENFKDTVVYFHFFFRLKLYEFGRTIYANAFDKTLFDCTEICIAQGGTGGKRMIFKTSFTHIHSEAYSRNDRCTAH